MIFKIFPIPPSIFNRKIIFQSIFSSFQNENHIAYIIYPISLAFLARPRITADPSSPLQSHQVLQLFPISFHILSNCFKSHSNSHQLSSDTGQPGISRASAHYCRPLTVPPKPHTISHTPHTDPHTSQITQNHRGIFKYPTDI